MGSQHMTVKHKFHLMQKYGFTNGQMKEYLIGRGVKDLDDTDVLARCALSMGFIWSFRSSRWLDKNPVGLGDDQSNYDEILDGVRFEKERQEDPSGLFSLC
jgi:hypothetical protein